MKIVVLATAWQKEELLAQPVDPVIEFSWLERPSIGAGNDIPDACIDLLFEYDPVRMQWLKQLNAPLTIINAVVTPLSELNEGFIRINGWNTFLKREVLEAAGNSNALKDDTARLFLSLGRQVEWVQDVPGFVTPRVVASLINEAYMALEEKVSVEEEIDTAMKLGTNYPYGPFEWSRKIGLTNVFHLLNTLSKVQKRYTPCKLLSQNVLA